VRPPRAQRQQARRQAPEAIAAQLAVGLGAPAAFSALRHLPGSFGKLSSISIATLFWVLVLCGADVSVFDRSMQEKRALLFCKEDRAILCRDCDVSVHTTSDLAMRHARFLLTGVRLSAEPAAWPAPPSDDSNTSSSFCCSAGDAAAPPAPATSNNGGSDSSSISEYLTETLPGWHVEDFLVDEATAAAAESYHRVGAISTSVIATYCSKCSPFWHVPGDKTKNTEQHIPIASASAALRPIHQPVTIRLWARCRFVLALAALALLVQGVTIISPGPRRLYLFFITRGHSRV
jgi:hypothetical protein